MRKPLALVILAGAFMGFHGISNRETTMARATAQECLHGPNETPPQRERRRDALGAARNVNNMQANQPGTGAGRFLRHEDLASSPFALKQSDARFTSLNLTPGQEILPGWTLELQVGDNGYWFMIKDKTDPCGFAFMSNTDGVIYTAEPIR
jgi:hypothetical protein